MANTPDKRASWKILLVLTENAVDATHENIADATHENIVDATHENIVDATHENAVDAFMKMLMMLTWKPVYENVIKRRSMRGWASREKKDLTDTVVESNYISPSQTWKWVGDLTTYIPPIHLNPLLGRLVFEAQIVGLERFHSQGSNIFSII